MGGLRLQEQLSKFIFAFLRVARDIPDFGNLSLIQSADVIRIPRRRFLNDGPIPVGGPNQEEDRRDQNKQDDSDYEQQEPLFSVTGHRKTSTELIRQFMPEDQKNGRVS